MRQTLQPHVFPHLGFTIWPYKARFTALALGAMTASARQVTSERFINLITNASRPTFNQPDSIGLQGWKCDCLRELKRSEATYIRI